MAGLSSKGMGARGGAQDHKHPHDGGKAKGSPRLIARGRKNGPQPVENVSLMTWTWHFESLE